MESSYYEKILGTILLLAGLAVISYSLYLGMNIFIKGQNPPEIFKPMDISAAPSKVPANNPGNPPPNSLNGANLNPADLQKLITNNLLSPEMIRSIIPPEMFSYASRILNLSVFTLFLWVLITAGAKISSLGIALIKTNSSVKV